MNSPSSDGNENVMDIFVLCKSETETPLPTEHLEQKGYLVTLFSDSTHLLETLRFGKPNLLICDSLYLGQEAYEVCRQIKADNELWMVPVLILTSASDLGDLLLVLDCNADNFIAFPSDPHYLLSLIEGMLITPVERQTPDQIKTQFKIQHDDHMFVVTADRRKLLEFLLSSFEIAVNKSEDLSRERTGNASLQDSLRKLQEAAGEQNRILGILNTTLKQKDQDIASLNAEVKDKVRQIADLEREKEFLVQEREDYKTELASAGEKVRSLEGEKDEASRAHALESGSLSQRISDLSEELTASNADLNATKQALAAETARRETAESTLGTLVPEKEQTEKALRALTLECEQVKSSCTLERNRALAAEQEARSLLQAKDQAEQDLTRIIDDLKGTAKQQAEDLISLRDERVADKNRISTLEVQLANLANEKEQLEAGLRKTTDKLKEELSGLRAACDTATISLEEKTRSLSTLQEAFAGQKAAFEKGQVQIHSLETELGAVRFALEQEQKQHASTEETLQGVIHERDSALSTLHGAHDEVRSDLSAHRDDLLQVRQDLAAVSEERTALRGRFDETLVQVRNLEEKIQLASKEQAESDKQVRSLADELDLVKATLDVERRQRRSREESLKTVSTSVEKAQEQLQQSLREQEQLKAIVEKDREAIRQAEERLQLSAKEQVRASASAHERRLSELLSEIAAANHRVQFLEKQVHTITREKLAAEEEASSLAAEIDQARTALADEWEDHMTANERLAAAVREKARLEASMQQADGPSRDIAVAPAVITRTTVLPAPVADAPRAVVAVPAAQEKPGVPRVSGVEDLFEDDAGVPDDEEELPVVTIVRETDPVATMGAIPCSAAPEIPEIEDDPAEAMDADGEEIEEESSDDDSGEEEEEGDSEEDAEEDNEGEDSESGVTRPLPTAAGFSFNRAQWFDLLKWAHHSGVLTQEQRLQIVRMGRLIRRGRRLTQKQDEQVREMLFLVQSLGYRLS